MILISLIILIVFVYYLWKQRRFYSASLKIEGPFAYPIIGNSLLLYDTNKLFDVNQRLRQIYKKPLIRFWLGPKFFVYTDVPTVAEAILTSSNCLDKGASYKFVSDVLGQGLITLPGHKWKVHRKLLNPSFHSNVINSFMEVFYQNTVKLKDHLAKRMENVEFDILEPIKISTMRMIYETVLDLNGNDKTYRAKDFLTAAAQNFKICGIRVVHVWYHLHFLFRLSKYFKLQEENQREIISITQTILREKLTKFKSKIGTQNDNYTDEKEDNRFIERLMKLICVENLMTEWEVVDEIITVIIAGYETTATTAAFALLTLAMHPEYQKRLFDEIITVLPDQESEITRDSLQSMTYLDMICKETLRLFPPVPYLTRQVTSDMHLDNICIPTGTELLIGVYYMQRNKEFMKCENPNEFHPENFMPKAHPDRHPYSYIPFSAGSRNCIGFRHGQIAVKMIVVQVIRNFILATPLKLNDLQFRMHLTMHLLNKHLVTIQKRPVN